MSMHEIEDIIEESLKLLYIEKPNNIDFRSAAYSLYRFQDQFDTGVTFLRLREILVESRYLYILPKNSLDKLKYPEIPEGGYYLEHIDKENVFIEAGTEAWKDVVNKGILTGEDTISPLSLDIYNLALLIMETSIKKGDMTLAASWYKDIFLMQELANIEDPEDAQNNETLKKIRELANENNLMEVEAFRYTDDLIDESDANEELIKWWTFNES